MFLFCIIKPMEFITFCKVQTNIYYKDFRAIPLWRSGSSKFTNTRIGAADEEGCGAINSAAGYRSKVKLTQKSETKAGHLSLRLQATAGQVIKQAHISIC